MRPLTEEEIKDREERDREEYLASKRKTIFNIVISFLITMDLCALVILTLYVLK